MKLFPDMMKLFPNAVLTWQEPVSYSYRNMGNRSWLLIPAVIIISLMIHSKHLPWWTAFPFLFLAVVLSFLPWIHLRWPSAFPMTGATVTLYDDRITRQSGKSQVYIALDNISECRTSLRTDKNISYSVLSFTPKKSGLDRTVLGILTETAVSDPEAREKITNYLRTKGISIICELPSP